MRTTPAAVPGPARARSVLVAAALLVPLGAAPAGASTAVLSTTAATTRTASAAAVDTVTWSLEDVQRTSAGIVVTGTGPVAGDSCSGIQVINPAAGRVGLGDGDGRGCTSRLASSPTAGRAATTFSATVTDPGGSTVDVVLGDRLVATDVPLDGGTSSPAPTGRGTWTLVPRATSMTARSTSLEQRFTRAGAAVAGQAVDLSTDVLFAYDSDVLGPDAGAAIDVAAEQLRARSSRSVTITGHTDSQGDTTYNLGLSQRRAEAVRAALAAELGPGWTLDATGVGESDPVADESRPGDATPEQADAAVAEAQRVNRRVEVVPG